VTTSKNKRLSEASYQKAVETALRVDLMNMIDTVFVAYKRSGRSEAEFVIVQYYEHLLFSAVNDPSLTPVYRIGGLKLIRLYLQALIDGYNREAALSEVPI
jgi:hypothetical protein